MLRDADARFLARIVEREAQAAIALAEARADRDEAVRIALESGGGAIEIAALTGLTRARIYQIKG